MHNVKKTKVVSAALISLLLSACGGGSSSPLDPPKNPSSSGGSGGSVSSGAVDATTPSDLGSGTGDSFVPGALVVGIGGATLSPGGTTTLSVNVVSPTNTLVTNPVVITFNSVCVANGEAVLKSGDATTNQVSTTNGQATITYTATGCVGDDEITASATLDGSTKTAKTTLSIAPDTIQTVAFVNATPTLINLKGTGGLETSEVVFQVLGSTGAPMKGVELDFSLSTSIGGLNLTNTAAQTDRSGRASTTVQAGSRATSVRVTAKVKGTEISTQSNQLIVSTGVPDQNSTSLSASKLFPIGAWDHDGIESDITIRLADAFNNPPPDGTAVKFTTEGGAIKSGCTTVGGACTVKWNSQEPRPQRNSPDNNAARKLCVYENSGATLPSPEYEACVLERAGRITVLATAIGNESFIDRNGNGFFDNGIDTFKSTKDGGNCKPNVPASSARTPQNSATIPCDDLAEAYLDSNENGEFDYGDTDFEDFDNDNVYDEENGLYNGVLCLVEGDGCTKTGVNIRDDVRLIMVSTRMLMRNGVFPFIETDVRLKMPTSSSNSSSSSGPVGPDSKEIWFWMADENGHGLPAGTTLALETENLKNATATISTKGPIAASADPARVFVSISANDSGVPSGTFNINVTIPAPGGDITVSQTVRVSAE